MKKYQNNIMKRKIQIGVMGSASDLKYSKKIETLAEEIGYWIAKNNVYMDKKYPKGQHALGPDFTADMFFCAMIYCDLMIRFGCFDDE